MEVSPKMSNGGEGKEVCDHHLRTFTFGILISDYFIKLMKLHVTLIMEGRSPEDYDVNLQPK